MPTMQLREHQLGWALVFVAIATICMPQSHVHAQASGSSCVDTPGFSDAYGNCANYAAHKWCTTSGNAGSEWQSAWGKLDARVISSCCACGKGEPTKPPTPIFAPSDTQLEPSPPPVSSTFSAHLERTDWGRGFNVFDGGDFVFRKATLSTVKGKYPELMRAECSRKYAMKPICDMGYADVKIHQQVPGCLFIGQLQSIAHTATVDGAHRISWFARGWEAISSHWHGLCEYRSNFRTSMTDAAMCQSSAASPCPQNNSTCFRKPSENNQGFVCGRAMTHSPTATPTRQAQWIKLSGKQCYNHRLHSGAGTPIKQEYFSVAQSYCQNMLGCSGVYQRGDRAYFLCDLRPAEPSTEGGQVWVKPASAVHSHSVTSTDPRKQGQQSAGKWCSNWCCCASGWHGEICDDVDECISSPCQNGGTCAESASTYLVNDYFRKYRCTCVTGHGGKPLFHGHNCETKVVLVNPLDVHCVLQLGAKSASGSTSNINAYKTFQMALEFTGITLKSSSTNFNRMCAEIYRGHEQGGVCGQTFVLYNTDDKPIATPMVNCTTGGVRHPELYVVMSLCSTPCMLDPASKCCFVPAEVAWMFPCCRALMCTSRAMTVLSVAYYFDIVYDPSI